MIPSCIGIDAIPPSDGARVKLYTLIRSNAFSAMRDAMTMGGLLTSRETLRGVEVLRRVYHLLRGDRSPLSEAEEDVSKPCWGEGKMGGSYWMGFTSYEMRPDRPEPEVKVYLPVMQFFQTEGEVVEALEEVWRGFGWGREFLGGGRYGEVVRECL